MEELRNIFIQVRLPVEFDLKIWKIIALEDPKTYQKRQHQLYTDLLNDKILKEKYFKFFERNHLNLYGWSLLVTREKVEIEPYLFRPILQHTPSIRISKSRNESSFPSSHLNSRTQPNQAKKYSHTPSASRQALKIIREQIDSHELYLRTFTACRGQRYIPYDHTRQLKLGPSKFDYNSCIRQKRKHRRNYSSPTQTQNALSKFEEWDQQKMKVSLINFTSVLDNIPFTSQCSERLLKRKGKNKFVFVNHQRKPINYYRVSQS